LSLKIANSTGQVTVIGYSLSKSANGERRWPEWP